MIRKANDNKENSITFNSRHSYRERLLMEKRGDKTSK